MSVRVAVIGTGIMGFDHARIVADDLSGATLQVICDISEQRARAVADKFNVTDVATDPSAAISRQDVDAVIIASPDQTHASLAIAAIEAGKSVLCEKPLAPTSKECLQVIEAEMKMGRQMIQLGFMRRFDPAYTEMKAIRDSGSLGEAIIMHNFHRNMTAPANFTGQMAITNSAPHEFDIARFVLGCEYTAISVFQPEGVDTSKTVAPVFMVLETTSGQLVNIEINNNAGYGYDVRGELVGEKGSVFLNAPINSRINIELNAVERYPEDWRPRFAEAYRIQNKSWIRSIVAGEISPVAASAWDGYCAAIVAEAGVKALSKGTKVRVNLVNKPNFYSCN